MQLLRSFFKSQELENQSIYVTETSHKCDGIGGVNWDGSLLLADYLCGSYAGLRSLLLLGALSAAVCVCVVACVHKRQEERADLTNHFLGGKSVSIGVGFSEQAAGAFLCRCLTHERFVSASGQNALSLSADSLHSRNCQRSSGVDNSSTV